MRLLAQVGSVVARHVGVGGPTPSMLVACWQRHCAPKSWRDFDCLQFLRELKTGDRMPGTRNLKPGTEGRMPETGNWKLKTRPRLPAAGYFKSFDRKWMCMQKLERGRGQPSWKASDYRSTYYRERGRYIERMGDAVIDRTDVDPVIARARDSFHDYPVIDARIGDPTQYPDLGSYSGYDRHLTRFTEFHSSSDYAGYEIRGNPVLKARLRMGRWHAPDALPVPPYLEVFITKGVAGALHHLGEALILPPTQGQLAHKDMLLKMTPDCGNAGSQTMDRVINFISTIIEKMERRAVRSSAVIPHWTYVSHIAEVFRAHGEVKLCGITQDGQIDLEGLERAIDAQTRGVLFATVGNPLSTAMEPKRFDAILEIVERKMNEFKHPIVVIADTIYEHFRRDYASRIDPINRALTMGSGVPVVEMSSFSKMLAIPGERVGYCRVLWRPEVHPDERADFMRSLSNLFGPGLGEASTSAQRALAEMFSAINNRAPVEEQLAPIAAVLTAMKELKDRGCMVERGSLFRADEIQHRLRSLGVPEGYFSASYISRRTRNIANDVLMHYDVNIKSERVADLMETLVAAGLVEVIERNDVLSHPMQFYRLVAEIPALEKDKSRQLQLYGISKIPEWQKVAEMCGIPTEDTLYEEHKARMRSIVSARVWYFAQEADKLRDLGIALHPAYYDEAGRLVENRFNSFYVLLRLTKLAHYNPEMSQAARLAELCVENGQPLIATMPAEKFILPEMRDDASSYVRVVPLQAKEVIDKMVQTLGIIARSLKDLPDRPDAVQLRMPLVQ